ncbi:MAG: reverse transcriptase family protein [Rhizobacter sp.]
MPSKQQHKREKAARRRGLRKNKSGRYPLEKSPLWRQQSLHKLAELLGTTPEELAGIAAAPTYNEFVDKPNTPKARDVQEPLGATMHLHYSLVQLLDRVQRPAFLHSATKKRSYITNAEAHRAGHAIVQTDIRKFYENTTYAHVKRFFFKDLGWPHDMAKLVAKACTVHGHLPTGSCISPLLSYFVHRVMFAGIEELCLRAGVAMTLYVDDLTLSGIHATSSLLHQVKARIQRFDLTTHKEKYVAPGNVGVVTGVALDNGQLHLRNEQHKALVEVIDLIHAGDTTLMNTLRGKLAAAQAVEPAAAAGLIERYKRQAPGGCAPPLEKAPTPTKPQVPQ